MAIPSAEDFERRSRRGILHHKSKRLLDVIISLILYHQHGAARDANGGFPKSLLLDNLHKVVVEWKQKDPKEFSARHGTELLTEVKSELGMQTEPELEDGDILFRYVGWGKMGLRLRRNVLHGLISLAQGVQQLTQKISSLGDKVFEGASTGFSWDRVQHVGIYVNGVVIEIGGMGLVHNHVEARSHHDLVVRFPAAFTHNICNVAKRAKEDLRQKIPVLGYPIGDLAKLALIPHTGGVMTPAHRQTLTQMDGLNRKEAKSFKMKQRVVCSHFVHAVLYAALHPYGTLRTATDHDTDTIFKISPSHLWRQFRQDQGLWAGKGARFVGMQYEGKIYIRHGNPEALLRL